jgi:hypothetical protein
VEKIKAKNSWTVEEITPKIFEIQNKKLSLKFPRKTKYTDQKIPFINIVKERSG